MTQPTNPDDTTGGIHHPDPGLQPRPSGNSLPESRPEGMTDEEWEQLQRDRLADIPSGNPEGVIDGTDNAT